MKFSKGMIASVAAGMTLVGAAAFAQPAVHRSTPVPPPGVPVAREVRQELWDLRKLEQLQDRFALARARHNRVAMRQVENELQRFLAVELRESRQDVREAKRDKRVYGKAARAEAKQESRELKRIRSIDRELTKLYGRYTRAAIAQKSQLIGELVTLARAEVRDARRDVRYVRR